MKSMHEDYSFCLLNSMAAAMKKTLHKTIRHMSVLSSILWFYKD